MPPSDGDDLRMIQPHEVLEIESQANCTKKMKRSKQHARELYQFNSLKARQERANVRSSSLEKRREE